MHLFTYNIVLFNIIWQKKFFFKSRSRSRDRSRFSRVFWVSGSVLGSNSRFRFPGFLNPGTSLGVVPKLNKLSRFVYKLYRIEKHIIDVLCMYIIYVSVIDDIPDGYTTFADRLLRTDICGRAFADGQLRTNFGGPDICGPWPENFFSICKKHTKFKKSLT